MADQILVPTSPGDLIDKLTILRLKAEQITDPAKRINVLHETNVLMQSADAHLTLSAKLDDLWAALYRINAALWTIEDDIREREKVKDFGDDFIRLARAVYVTNDRRAEVKKQINLLLGSAIIEEKSYSDHGEKMSHNVDEARRLLRKEAKKLTADLKTNRSRSRANLVRQLHDVRQMLSPQYAYTSQAGQDLIVDQVMKNARSGTFVDVGGYDGVTGSNTFFLETHRGWSGALIEPVPAQLAKAQTARSCPCIGVAIGQTEGEADFIEITEGFTQMSGLAQTYDAKLLGVVRNNKRHQEKMLKVQTKTLSTILHDTGHVNPDFVSLDIEGGELACLKTFPFAEHDVKIWSIENNTGTPEIKQIMETNGYDLIEFCGPDEMYFKRSP